MNIPGSTKSISMVAVVVAVTALVLAGCDSAGAGGGGGGGGSDVTLGTGEYVINYSPGGSEAGTGTYTYLTQPLTVVSLIPDAATGPTGQEHAFNFHPGSGAPDGNADGLATGTYQITDSYDTSDSSAQVVWIVDTVPNGYTAPFLVPEATDGTIPVSGTLTVTEASTDSLFGTFEGTFDNVVMDTDDDLSTTADQITINGSFVLSPL